MIPAADLAATRRAAITALAGRLRKRTPVDVQGYAASFEDNLLPGLTPPTRAAVKKELGGGAGSELGRARPKAAAAHSSAGLAVNVFARWRDGDALAQLPVAGVRGFDAMAFERPFPSGLRGTAPHLDVVLNRASTTVAVESKCIEPLAPHAASFSPAYDDLVASVAAPSWQALFNDLRADPSRFQLLDAAQLLKHYLGLKRLGSPVTLMYVYWEPTDADDIPAFVQHRQEIAHLHAALHDPDVAFESLSYPELWRTWERDDDSPPWLGDHLAGLRARYAVPLSGAA